MQMIEFCLHEKTFHVRRPMRFRIRPVTKIAMSRILFHKFGYEWLMFEIDEEEDEDLISGYVVLVAFF